MLPVTGRPRRVAIVQRALRRYHTGFYDVLRERLAGDGVDLRLLHSTPAAEEDPRDDRLVVPWSTHVPRRTFAAGGRKLVWQPLTGELRRSDLVVVEQASQLLLNYRLLARQARGGPSVAFWGHGRSFADDPSALGERLKDWSSRRAHWWFAYTSRSADIVADLGYDPERITVVDNAIDTAALRDDLDALAPEDVRSLRAQLGLGTGPVGLFLGNLRTDKRLDVLLAAAERVRERKPGFQLVLVGAGSSLPALREVADRAAWVHVVGPRYGSERAAFLAVADVVLVPGAVGLVVLDAFVARTPLITSREAAHGPEIAYLRDGENGRLVTHGTDPAVYAAAVLEVLEDPRLLARLRSGCAEAAGRYSVQAMATRFAEGVRLALAAPRQPGLPTRRRPDQAPRLD